MIAKICPLLASPLTFVSIAFSFKVRLMSVKVKRVSLAFVFIPTEKNMILKKFKRNTRTTKGITTYIQIHGLNVGCPVQCSRI